MQWHDLTLPEVIADLWPDSQNELAEQSSMARNTFRRVMRGGYVDVPTNHLTRLAQVLQRRWQRYGVVITADMLIKCYRQSS